MKILLVAGGSSKLWPEITIENFDYVVGADRGCLSILQQNWVLHLAVGDFDSLTDTQRQWVKDQAQEVSAVSAEKNDTDTQLALLLIFTKFPEAQVTIIGATGGRMDHFLSNLWLPLEKRFMPYIRQIQLRDCQNSVHYYPAGTYVISKEQKMNYLAYCCLTAVHNLTLKDSKYVLDQVNVLVPTSYVSNEFITNVAKLSFDQGIIAVIQSKDL